jgi:hypothetical protein
VVIVSKGRQVFEGRMDELAGGRRGPADLERRFLELTESEYLPEATDVPAASAPSPVHPVPTPQEGDR